MTGQFGKGSERMGPSAVGKLVRWVIYLGLPGLAALVSLPRTPRMMR